LGQTINSNVTAVNLGYGQTLKSSEMVSNPTKLSTSSKSQNSRGVVSRSISPILKKYNKYSEMPLKKDERASSLGPRHMHSV